MRWLLLFGLWFAYFSFGAIIASIAPLVDAIQADLALSYGALGSVMGAWQLVYIGAAIPAGMLLDRLGARVALCLGIALIAASAAGRAFATGYWSLLGAVMLFGAGGPIISSGAPKVVTDVFEGSTRGLAMGIYMTGPTLGGVAALTLTHTVLMPAFDDDWRAVLLLWGALAAAAMLGWFTLATLAGPRTRGFVRADDGGERAGGFRMIGRITRLPTVRLVLAMGVGVFLINHGLSNWLPELLYSGGMTLTAASNWAALPMVIGAAGSLVIPRLATPARRYRILLLLSLSAAAASIALTVVHPLVLPVALVLQGLVRASLMTVLILTLVELPGLDSRYAGTASGLFFTAAEVGGVLGPLGLGLLYDLTGGFDAGLYALTAVAAAMALGTLRLARLVRRAE
ncbi:MAG TPA: MFS transporter [Pseudomonadales bacterium]